VLGRPFGAEHGARTTAVSPEATNTHLGHYSALLAVDMLIGNVQEFMLLLAVERGFPVSINGNG